MFQFDRAVQLSSAELTPFNISFLSPADNDSSVGHAMLNTPWNTTLSNSAVSQLTGSLQHFAGTGSPYRVNLNPSNAVGNVWLIGADFSGRDRRPDAFKIDALRVITPAVPEPATWAMMLLGFGAVGYSMRRRKGAPQISYAV